MKEQMFRNNDKITAHHNRQNCTVLSIKVLLCRPKCHCWSLDDGSTFIGRKLYRKFRSV